MNQKWFTNAEALIADARMEVKAAVEEWFSNVSLDDLFVVKGWAPRSQGPDPKRVNDE